PACAANSQARRPVALVSMPFASAARPSIQLGLLKAVGQEKGFPVSCWSLDLDFAYQIGLATFEIICNYGRCFLGDWLFSCEAFGDQAPDKEGRYLELNRATIKSLLDTLDRPLDYIMEMRRNEVPRYLDRLMEVVPWERYAAVGFTSTFQQNVASFALARR